MRITGQMSTNSLVTNLNRQQAELDDIQHQLGTGIKIRRPSDDPGLASNQMYFRSRLHELNQFKKNIDDSNSRLKQVDGVFERVTDILQRVRTLSVQAANGIYQGDKGFELEVAIKKEIDQHLRSIIDLANTRDATGRFLFGGHTIEHSPFEAIEAKPNSLQGIDPKDQIVGVRYRGNIGEQYREIERGEYIPVSVPGNQAFWGTNMSITSNFDNSEYRSTSEQAFRIDGVEIQVSAGDTIDDIIDKINNAPVEVKASKLGNDNITLVTTSSHQIWLEEVGAGTVLRDIGLIDPVGSEPPNNYSTSATVSGLSIFDVLIQFKNDLTAHDQERISGRDIQDIDLAIENILKNRAVVGARTNRIEQHNQRVEFDKTFMTEMLAKNEGVDFPEAIMNLKWLESVHQYALNVGAKIIKPTLLDFLR